MTLVISLILAVIVMNTVAQLLLKKGANSDCHIFLNPYVISAYGMFVVIVLLGYEIMKHIDLKNFAAIMGINYLVASLSACVVFKEKMRPIGYLGIILLAAGILAFHYL